MYSYSSTFLHNINEGCLSHFIYVCEKLTFFNSRKALYNDKPTFTKHFNESLFNITDKGLFSVEILLDGGKYHKLGKDIIGIVIHNQYDKDVEGANVKITAMPEDQSGAIVPVIKDGGTVFIRFQKSTLRNAAVGAQDRCQESRIRRRRVFPFPRCFEYALAQRKYSAD